MTPVTSHHSENSRQPSIICLVLYIAKIKQSKILLCFVVKIQLSEISYITDNQK